MAHPFRKVFAYDESMKKINTKEWSYYLLAMVAAVMVELSIQSGVAICTFPLIMLIVLFISLKYIFPIEPEK